MIIQVYTRICRKDISDHDVFNVEDSSVAGHERLEPVDDIIAEAHRHTPVLQLLYVPVGIDEGEVRDDYISSDAQYFLGKP